MHFNIKYTTLWKQVKLFWVSRRHESLGDIEKAVEKQPTSHVSTPCCFLILILVHVQKSLLEPK